MIKFTTDQIANLEKSDSLKHFQQKVQKQGILLPSIRALVRNSYAFATSHSYSIQQKQQLLNFIIEQVYEIPKLKTAKGDFIKQYPQKIANLSNRTAQKTAVKFSWAETEQIRIFYERQVLPFYELYEFVLDDNEEFNFVTFQYDPVPTVSECHIFEGQVVQPQTIAVLKELVGERALKQQKKDPKKK